MQALRTAATGMSAQQLNVEVISNNIANMNTVGFKRQRAEFQDLLYQTLERAGAQSSDQGTIVPTGVQVGAGVKAGSTYRITEQGAMTQTGNKLDVAIQGRGFLQVLMPSGETAYTRAGNLSTNDQGQLVTEDGYQVQPGITIPDGATGVSISPDGLVEAFLPAAAEPTQIGQIQIARFVNKAGLESKGENLFLETASSGPAQLGTPNQDGVGSLLQGYLEMSNVNAVTEIADLIAAQRAYEMNARVVSAGDQMLQATSQLR